MEALEHLKRINACTEAQEWAKEHGGTLKELWDACERPEWLLFFVLAHNRTFPGLSDRDFRRLACDFMESLVPEEALAPFARIQAYAYHRATKEEFASAWAEQGLFWPTKDRQKAAAEAPLALRTLHCDRIRAEIPFPKDFKMPKRKN